MIWVEEAGPYQPFLEGSIYCLYEADDFFTDCLIFLDRLIPSMSTCIQCGKKIASDPHSLRKYCRNCWDRNHDHLQCPHCELKFIRQDMPNHLKDYHIAKE